MGLLRKVTMIDLLCGLRQLLAKLGIGELREQAHCMLLQVAGQVGPDGREDAGRRNGRWLTTHGGPSRKVKVQGDLGAM